METARRVRFCGVWVSRPFHTSIKMPPPKPLVKAKSSRFVELAISSPEKTGQVLDRRAGKQVVETHDAFDVWPQGAVPLLQSEKGVHRQDIVLRDHADLNIGYGQAESLHPSLVPVDQVSQVQADHGRSHGYHVPGVTRNPDARIGDVVAELARRETAGYTEPGDDDGRYILNYHILCLDRSRERHGDQYEQN